MKRFEFSISFQEEGQLMSLNLGSQVIGSVFPVVTDDELTQQNKLRSLRQGPHEEAARKQPLLDRCDEVTFSPSAYLQEYYSDIGAENAALLEFYVAAYKTLPPNGTLLDFGGGPTIYPLIGAVPKVKEIYFCDYLEVNLEEVRKWVRADAMAFNWQPFVRATLELEQRGICSPLDILRREAALRQRMKCITQCDIRLDPPIQGMTTTYDTVISNFCAEAATANRQEWITFVARIVSLVKPGGTFLISAIKGATSYSVGSQIFSTVNLDETVLTAALLRGGCQPESITISSIPADCSARHYTGVMFAKARKC
jgi:hypothetical protein